jgi:hypothetical protein
VPDSTSRVIFETWASDKDTFSVTPHWPEQGAELEFRVSVLDLVKSHGLHITPKDLRAAGEIDEDCKAPKGAAVGGFPTTGTPVPCIAEQVARNRILFDDIVSKKLNTKAGLAAAYASGAKVEMRPDAIAIKGDWIPLPALLQWIPQLRDISTIKKLYFTARVKDIEYALVSMHVASRQNPNWVWGTFEHEMNPGRCDDLGCLDSFGALKTSVPPNRVVQNTQYGPCEKTPQLKALMAQALLSSVWEHYCLKSTQVDYTDSDGTPYALGNTVIEGIVGNGTVAASSCIACHTYASFGPTGAPTAAAVAILPFNPLGRPIPEVLAGSHQFAFMWGVLLAP